MPDSAYRRARSRRTWPALLAVLTVPAVAWAVYRARPAAPQAPAPPAAAPRAARPVADGPAPSPGRPARRGQPPRVGELPPMPAQRELADPPGIRVETLAEGLDVPWGIAWAPDGRVFFTERPGRVRVFRNGRLQPEPYFVVPTVDTGEGGLMGLALHPEFAQSPYVYLQYTYRQQGRSYNAVVRLRDTGRTLVEPKVIQDRIPGAWNHNGGGLAFGPDGMLYVATGDAAQPPLAQDMTSAAGKILRYTPDGGVPADNPFPNSPIYALGLRNVQGMAWHPGTGRLWVTMHGPSGEFPGIRFKDAVFELHPGANCGWPHNIGVVNEPGITDPVLWYPERAVPPAAAIFYTGDQLPQLRGNLLFASLGAQHLQRVVLDERGRPSTIERWFPGRYGRLRLLAQGPDGLIYLGTSRRSNGSNQTEGPGRDVLLRLRPAG